MTRPNFRPIAPLDVDDQALERVNERLGVPAMVLQPQSSVAAARRHDGKTSPQGLRAPHKRLPKLTARIPSYLLSAVKQRALDENTTVRVVVMRALQKDGFIVNEADFAPGSGGSD